MARLILDTDVLIGAERGRLALESVIGADDDTAIAAVTAAELLHGVELADDTRRAARRSLVDGVLAVVPVIDYTIAVARPHARLMADTRRRGVQRGAHDLIIAATAVATDRTLLTFDRGFTDIPELTVRVLDKQARRSGR